MIKTLKEFLASSLPQDDRNDEDHEKSIELCAAVLMLEISLADSSSHEDEHHFIEDAIKRHFQLNAEEAATILELAHKEVDHSVSMYEFTRMINDSLSMEEKIRIVELLWQVANVDAVIDKYEEFYIRKIADLLYVPHKEYIKAKLRAAQKAEQKS